MGFVVILDLLVSRKTIFQHPSCPEDAALYGADRDVEITGEMIIGSLIQVYCKQQIAFRFGKKGEFFDDSTMGDGHHFFSIF